MPVPAENEIPGDVFGVAGDEFFVGGALRGATVVSGSFCRTLCMPISMPRASLGSVAQRCWGEYRVAHQQGQQVTGENRQYVSFLSVEQPHRGANAA